MTETTVGQILGIILLLIFVVILLFVLVQTFILGVKITKYLLKQKIGGENKKGDK